MQKSVHISSLHSVVILLEMKGFQMHPLHPVDTGIDVTIWHLLFSLRCITYFDQFIVISVGIY